MTYEKDLTADVKIPDETIAKMRWENSPLNRRIMDVIRYRKEHRDREHRVGDNKATNLVMFAAEELVEVYEDILAGKRDAQGYPQTG